MICYHRLKNSRYLCWINRLRLKIFISLNCWYKVSLISNQKWKYGQLNLRMYTWYSEFSCPNFDRFHQVYHLTNKRSSDYNRYSITHLWSSNTNSHLNMSFDLFYNLIFVEERFRYIIPYKLCLSRNFHKICSHKRELIFSSK